MLESLSCIFSARTGGQASPVAQYGELPDDIDHLEFPQIAPGQSAIRKLGQRLVVLAPRGAGTLVGFVLDEVPPATQLNRIARRLSELAAAGDLSSVPAAATAPDGSAALLTSYLGKADGRVSLRRLLSLCCDAMVNAGLAADAAIIVCRPGQQYALTLSSVRLEPMRDAVSDLLHRWRGDSAQSLSFSPEDLDEETLQREDAVILLDKAGASRGFVSLPAADEGGYGFLLFDPSHPDPESVCRELRGVLELKHRTRRDWSQRRKLIRYGMGAAAAALAIFLLLPTDRVVTATGVTRPQTVQIVSLHFPSYLDRMEVEIGETLDAGAPIATLLAPDQRDARAATTYQIAIEEAAANAALAADDYGAYVQAQSRVALQRTRLQQIDARLALLNPVAEQGGRVVSALTDGERGRYLPSGTEIARIQTGHGYVFELRLNPSDAGLLSVGQSGQLALRGQLEQAFAVTVQTPPAPDERLAEDGSPPVLVATAVIESNGRTEIVPGLSGFARINTGRDIRIRVWTRHIVEFIRMKAWTILNWRI